jgi:predicted TIM-barrel enzyme
MTIAVPATGTLVKMGSVYNAYYVASGNTAPAAGTVVSLNTKLGSRISITANTITKLSNSFGGRQGPYDYRPT